MDYKKYFSEPTTADHRRYEALRAYCLEEGATQKEIAKRFGYAKNTFQAIVRDFKQQKFQFFPGKKSGPKGRRTPDPIIDKIIALRKKNHSAYDIHDILKEEKSADTIGNVFFLKKKILKPKNWRNLIVVTSDFHIERAIIIFENIMGQKYSLKFVGSKAFNSKTLIYKILGFEKDFILLTKSFFKNIKPGDDREIKRMIEKLERKNWIVNADILSLSISAI